MKPVYIEKAAACFLVIDEKRKEKRADLYLFKSKNMKDSRELHVNPFRIPFRHGDR